MLAVIQAGGKQYLVKEGQELHIELLEQEPGATLDFQPFLVTDEEGTDVKVGTPEVKGAMVTATVLEHGKEKKVSVIKYKPKVRYRRNVGHRQPFTKIKIEKITV
ncbi:MAG: 50S ribosomal protein L21 [Candidatus Uhrbacteria bacterium GW2011_GWE2_40_58]|nr:MAG: 50S ribosomal protein L21 [Candidatus Uhrbacteria bacterium GW2011_GWF2_40_263]KKR67080.1 MAG: 50S ribosomal protein L21 [Candidatus Uhrbacteria bacterium GW2011_GWE2_40_58]OGL93993.1 MAG: 50S ribosomal protein L21 [Candidatus Uhrbacteria bacterium RIFOXYA2_FULL_40_9]OGL97825.1 MAG: 50S ribosomal protein L21 [Candidatus Uhrbacteria bacterium RIFOXYB2_FULL_41_18]HBK35229.1 50S ribosomal protein L21 [Candidatus Uhrbacteria bacterium]